MFSTTTAPSAFVPNNEYSKTSVSGFLSSFQLTGKMHVEVYPSIIPLYWCTKQGYAAFQPFKCITIPKNMHLLVKYQNISVCKFLSKMMKFVGVSLDSNSVRLWGLFDSKVSITSNGKEEGSGAGIDTDLILCHSIQSVWKLFDSNKMLLKYLSASSTGGNHSTSDEISVCCIGLMIECKAVDSTWPTNRVVTSQLTCHPPNSVSSSSVSNSVEVNKAVDVLNNDNCWCPGRILSIQHNNDIHNRYVESVVVVEYLPSNTTKSVDKIVLPIKSKRIVKFGTFTGRNNVLSLPELSILSNSTAGQTRKYDPFWLYNSTVQFAESVSDVIKDVLPNGSIPYESNGLNGFNGSHSAEIDIDHGIEAGADIVNSDGHVSNNAKMKINGNGLFNLNRTPTNKSRSPATIIPIDQEEDEALKYQQLEYDNIKKPVVNILGSQNGHNLSVYSGNKR